MGENGENLEFIKHSQQQKLIKRKKRSLNVIDTLLSCTFIVLLIVTFWRCTWTLMDIYTEYLPKYIILFIVVLFNVFVFLYRDDVQHFIGQNEKKFKTELKYTLIRRVYVYFYALICIAQWRSEWAMFDEWIGLEFKPDGTACKEPGLGWLIITITVCVFSLVSLKALRNVIASPFLIILDNTTAPFDIPTRFRSKMSEKTWLYVLDCLFSVLVVGTLVVFVWRGAWVLLDDFIFPENFPTSATTSLIIGYAAVAIAFALQPLMRWVCDRLTGIPRLIAADIFLVFSLFGTVNVWRGIWNLLNIYFLPNNLELSCWITHWVCLILLILLGCSNSLLVRGVYIDAEEPAGKCVIFPCYYLRLIFQQERAKKLARRLQLEVLAKRKQDVDNNLDASNHVAQIKQIDYNCVV